MRTAITTLLLFIFSVSFSQGRIDPVSWEKIETDILDKKNLEDVRNKLQQIKESAIEREDDIAAARSLYLLMHIADRRTEDTLFFENSSFIDSTLEVTKSPRMSAIMHLIKGKRLMYFRKKYSRYPTISRFKSGKATQYLAMSEAQLDSVCTEHFDKALRLAFALNGVDPSYMIWLSYDPLLFLFKPDFRDIVFAEKLFFLDNAEPGGIDYSAASRLGLSPDKFFAMPDTTVALYTHIQTIFRNYKEWAGVETPVRDARYYYIELLAHAYLFEKSEKDSASESAYEGYLERQLKAPYGAVRGTAAVNLAGLWRAKGARYYNGESGWYRLERFDEKYREYYAKAHRMIDQYVASLDSFPVLQRQLQALKMGIERPEVRLSAHKEQLPGKSIASVVMFKNTRKLHVGIIKIPLAEKIIRDRKRIFSNGEVVRDTIYQLPDVDDFQSHASYLKLDGLPAGRYLVFSSGTDLKKDTTARYFELSVSNIAILNNDHRVFVLNRTTGFPQAEATILADGKHKKVNASGFVMIGNLDTSMTVIAGQDSLLAILKDHQPEYPDELYQEDDYDDLMDYYEDNIRLRVFTDRGIYRPGQTVYYKGIFTVPDPRTGEWRVLNWKNLKAPFFKKLFYRLSLKVKKERIEVSVSDAFNREFKTLQVWPDKFGSFSGSFVLPKNAATGEWNFDCDMFTVESAHGEFSVEEYKRPSFELTLKKPEKELKLGDDFDVTIKTRSFAGAKLDGVNVKYIVSALSRGFSAEDASRWGDTILVGTGITDIHGELRVAVSDSTYLKEFLTDWNENLSVLYKIEVQATDRTGESHEEELGVMLSARPVKIGISVPEYMDRADIKPLQVSTKSEFAGQVGKQVDIKLRRVIPNTADRDPLFSYQTDVWMHTPVELNQWFPDINFYKGPGDRDELRGEIVFETKINTGRGEKLLFPYEMLQPGSYSLELSCMQNDSLLGNIVKGFSVFDSKQRQLPEGRSDISFIPFNMVDAGRKLMLYTGNRSKEIFSIFHMTYFEKGKKKLVAKDTYEVQPLKKGLNTLKFMVPAKGVEEVEVTYQYILNNKLYIETEKINVSPPVFQYPELIVEQYRTRLTPGAKETFKVSIRSKDLQKANQLMTVMYDATLDKLTEHDWKVRDENRIGSPGTEWDHSISADMLAIEAFNDFSSVSPLYGFSASDKKMPVDWLWWQSDSITRMSGNSIELFVHSEEVNGILKRLPGLSFAGEESLQEVVVTALGRSLAGRTAGLVIRGNASFSLSGYSSSLIIIDGVVYEGDVSKVDVSLLTDGIVIKGADAVALYGSRASNGVVILSTKGPIVWPVKPPEQTVIRQNFSETAFFFPKILADKNGVFTINFTLPESVTEWKWKMLAHDKHARFTYAERTIVSQLSMMVQPEMPRFLYQGDQLILKSRISNLDSNTITGTVKCVVEDLVTGDDITAQLVGNAQQSFSVKAKSNNVAGFNFIIPDTMIHPLRVRIVAAGKDVSDGEEHIIPVLFRKIMVTKSVPLVMVDQLKPALPADAQAYGVSAYIQPKAYASVLQALPYLANYAYDCSEQTFNKILAHAMAAKLMRSDTALQRGYKEYASLPSQEVLPVDSLAEGRGEATPWLQIEFANNRHQRALFGLLDTLAGDKKISDYIDVLLGNQQADGGLSWFKDGNTDPYISSYVLAGLGKLKRDGVQLVDRPGSMLDNKYTKLVNALVGYTDKLLAGSDKGPDRLFALYARSYWLNNYSLTSSVRQIADSLTGQWFAGTRDLSLGRTAILISTALRLMPHGSELYDKAIAELESLRQQAISDGNGIRWKIISDSDDLSVRGEEWLVKIAEAFEESGSDKETVNGILEWLLRSKQDHQWSTTKSTGDAVSLLSRHHVISQQQTVTANADAGSLKIAVSDDLLTGRQYGFFNLYAKTFPNSINVSSNLPKELRGSLNYYYFTTQPPQVENGPMLTKTIYRYDDSTKNWAVMNEKTVFRVGDKVKVKLTIETNRRLQYVFIDDKRAAAFEPADPLSGYQYGAGFGYYRSVADEGFHFFANEIPAGRSSIEYEMVTNAEGVFSNGIGVLQCMYSPDVKAYTQDLKVTSIAK